MKLLRLRIDTDNGFRSLGKGFEVLFHQFEDVKENDSFRPICLVGLNGCGKSNVLEALSLIFYHIELCVGIHLPYSIKSGTAFRPRHCVIDAFTLEYMMEEPTFAAKNTSNRWVRITISKEKDKEPIMFKTEQEKDKKVKIDLKNLSEGKVAIAKSYLPKYIVGYSSGENETLSIPFIKSRFIHLFEFKEATMNNVADYIYPENSLIYVDANMSQAILLSCLLFENEETLKSLADIENTGILGITSFRMRLREDSFKSDKSSEEYSYFRILKTTLFEKLEACSTMSWLDKEANAYYFDFWVNEATKQAFRYHFHSGMGCFLMLRLLYELNLSAVGSNKENEIFSSEGVYTDGKYSKPGADNDIFHFLDFYLRKKVGRDGECKNLLLRQFSDGEHQFIHTMAICLLLKDSDSLILLDEPETHFNPSWRSRFVSILNETLRNASQDKNANFKKEVLITSHSPFIISDCLPENVIILDKDKNGISHVSSAKERGFNTYGASTNIIMAEIFDSTDSIGGRAYQEMQDMAENEHVDKKSLIKQVNDGFGDSLEKMMMMGKINERK